MRESEMATRPAWTFIARQNVITTGSGPPPHGTGEITVEEQELGHALRRDAAVPLPERLEGARRAQERRPLQVVERGAHIGHGWQQEEVLHIEHPRRLVRPFQLAAEAGEVPSLIVGHRSVHDACEQEALLAYPAEERVRVGGDQRA